MTQAVDPYQRRREEWVDRVVGLVDQIKQWCQAEGWTFEEESKTILEEHLGQYSLPALRITVAGGTLYVNPIALHVLGSDGRVDLEAYPTLSRVKLVGTDGAWKVMTDSNVPLRVPWDHHSFIQLVSDLMA